MPRSFVLPKSAEPQTLDEIRAWHLGMVDALLEQRASVKRAIRTGSRVSPRFVGMTESDLDAHFDSQRGELNRLTMLNLVASAEASVTVDYFRRVQEKRKDSLSTAYRKWHETLSKKKKARPNFDEEGILEVLKKSGVIDNNLIGRYRECLRVRHWVGHGRHWNKPMDVDRLDVDDVHERANALLQALPIG